MKKSMAERVWSKVEKTESCWLWTSAVYRNGYARLNLTARTHARVHRLAYELAYGEIPAGKMVCHACDVKRCVRPDHLFLGTQKDNMQDALRKGWKPAARVGHAPTNFKMTPEQIVDIREHYATGLISQAALGLHYGLQQTTVGQIVRRDNWKQVH